MVTQNVLRGFLYDDISMFKVSVQESSDESGNCWQGGAMHSYACGGK